jgi:hypothetical protein
VENYKNPYEQTHESKNDIHSKNNGLTLGLDKIPTPSIGVGHHNNVFRTSMPSPMEAYISHGIDNENEKLKQMAYLQQFGRSTYPVQSPSEASSNRILARCGKKETEQSPKVEIMPNIFQTPTSRGYLTKDMLKYHLNRDETRSFLPCVDIAANRAVYNQQRQGNKEGMTSPANFFLNSPYALTNNFQHPYRYNNANLQNAGSFGASPGIFGASP